MESTQTDFITVINSLLLVVDYRSDMLDQVRSGDKKVIRESITAAAKAAVLLNVPVVLTTRGPGGKEQFLNEISEDMPAHEIIVRGETSNDALEDPEVFSALRKYKREKLIIAGLWTSESLLETAIHSINEGYDVFGLIDACGDTSSEKHNMGVHRLLKAGVTPITWLSLASEWMNGWAMPADVDTVEITGKYNVMLSHISKY